MKIPIYIVKNNGKIIDGYFFKRSAEKFNKNNYQVKKEKVPVTVILSETFKLIIETCWIASKYAAKRNEDKR